MDKYMSRSIKQTRNIYNSDSVFCQATTLKAGALPLPTLKREVSEESVVVLRCAEDLAARVNELQRWMEEWRIPLAPIPSQQPNDCLPGDPST